MRPWCYIPLSGDLLPLPFGAKFASEISCLFNNLTSSSERHHPLPPPPSNSRQETGWVCFDIRGDMSGGLVDGLGYVWTRACVSLSRPQASWDHELSNVVSVISHLPLHHKSHRQNPRPRPHPAFHFHFHLSLLRAVVLRNDITRTPSISI
jgi:hypothetical protein